MTTSITAERTQWAARISAAWHQSVTSIIETGRLLTEAKAALDHGEWLPMVETDLPFRRNTAQRLMKIAADSRLANRAHVPLLPPSWGTLWATYRWSTSCWRRAPCCAPRPNGTGVLFHSAGPGARPLGVTRNPWNLRITWANWPHLSWRAARSAERLILQLKIVMVGALVR
jgi:hypothetical protein